MRVVPALMVMVKTAMSDSGMTEIPSLHVETMSDGQEMIKREDSRDGVNGNLVGDIKLLAKIQT